MVTFFYLPDYFFISDLHHPLQSVSFESRPIEVFTRPFNPTELSIYICKCKHTLFTHMYVACLPYKYTSCYYRNNNTTAALRGPDSIFQHLLSNQIHKLRTVCAEIIIYASVTTRMNGFKVTPQKTPARGCNVC